eukprot:UN26921
MNFDKTVINRCMKKGASFLGNHAFALPFPLFVFFFGTRGFGLSLPFLSLPFLDFFVGAAFFVSSSSLTSESTAIVPGTQSRASIENLSKN